MNIHDEHTQDAAFGVLGFAAGSIYYWIEQGANAFFLGMMSAAGALTLRVIYKWIFKRKK